MEMYDPTNVYVSQAGHDDFSENKTQSNMDLFFFFFFLDHILIMKQSNYGQLNAKRKQVTTCGM